MSAASVVNQAVKTDVDGIVRLAVAMVAQGREAAAGGCPEARRWISECSAAYFLLLTGDLERADELAWKLAREINENDENEDADVAQLRYEQIPPSDFYQLEMFGLSAD